MMGIRHWGKFYLLFNLYKDYLLAEATDDQQIKDEGMYYVRLDEV